MGNALDQAYWEHLSNTGGGAGTTGFQMLRYMKMYGLTFREIDDAMNKVTSNMREGAVNHPKSMIYGGKTFAQLAKEEGYDDDLSYLRDNRKNRLINWPVRALGTPNLTDGAAAMILCASEVAEKIAKKKPIELSGIGQGAGIAVPPGSDMRFVNYAEDGAKRQCFDMAGISDPGEFEYMAIHDPNLMNHINDAELVGYMRPGEGWQMILRGETRFDGRRPMQTQGGETQFGDSNDPAALVDIIEAVQQMRGECGPRQMPRLPKCSIIVGRGVHSIGMMVLRDRN